MPRILAVLHWPIVIVVSCGCSMQAPAVGSNPSSCEPVVAHAISSPGDSAIEPARPREVFIPPLPAPPGLRGHTVLVHMHVTERGLVTPGSVVIDSVSDLNYKRQLELVVGRMRVQPARLAGCWVPGTMMLRYDFDKKRS